MKYKRVLLVIFVFVILLSLGFLSIKNNDKKIETSFLTQSSIEIETVLPVSDTLGKKFTGEGTQDGVQGYIEFTVKNPDKKSKMINVLLSLKDTDQNLIKDNYIKVYLTDFDNNPYKGFEKNRVPAVSEFVSLTEKPKYKVVYETKITGGKEMNFRLRAWLADSYVISDEKGVFPFEITVSEK